MIGRWLWTRVRELAGSRRLDRQSADELAHHIDLTVERYIRAGHSERDARRLARLELGDAGLAREDLRAGRAGFLVEQAWRDARLAGRALRHAPGSAALAVATMGLGIGVSTVLFSLLSGIVLRPLPYPEPDRLVSVYQSNPQAGLPRTGVASGNIDDWRQRSRTLEGLAAYYTTGRTLVVGRDAAVFVTAQVTDDYFPILGVAPALGTTFTPDDFRRPVQQCRRPDRSGSGGDPLAPAVAAIIWRRSLHRRPVGHLRTAIVQGRGCDARRLRRGG